MGQPIPNGLEASATLPVVVKLRRIAGPAFVGILFIFITVFLWPWVDGARIAQIWHRANVLYIACSFAAYVISVVLRSVRWRLLIYGEQDMSFLELFKITCVHNFATFIFPLRLGEAVYPLILKRNYRIALSQTIGHVFVARLVDFGLMGLFLVLASLFSPVTVQVQVIGFGGLIVFAVSMISLGCARPLVRRVHLLMSDISSAKIARLWGRARPFLETITGVGLSGMLFRIFGVSFIALIFKNAAYCLLVFSFEDAFKWYQIFVGVTFAEVLIALPLHISAGIGTLEAGWVSGFRMMGISPAIALNGCIFVHAYMVAFNMALGMWAAIALHRSFFSNK